MKMRLTNPRRRGFSLLEVLLASVIAVLLMSGLYVAMDVQLRQAEIGREVVSQATLVRAIVQKVSGDLAPSITVIAQVKSPTSSSSSSGTASSTTSSTGTSTSSVTVNTSSTSSSSSSSSSSSGSTSSSSSTSGSTSDPSSSTATTIPSQAGVIGDGSTVSIYVARVPTSPPQNSDNPGEPPPTSPDVRLVSYSVGETGLVRQEQAFLTGDTSGLDSDGVTTTVIADEVTQIQFQYWDGATWSANWDGSALGEDLLTPIGPPMAIEMKIWIKQPNGAEPKMYRHVIALNTGMTPVTSADEQTIQQTTPMQ